MKYDDVSKLRNVQVYLDNIDIETLVIFSQTTIKKCNITLNNPSLKCISTKEITKVTDKIDKKIELYKGIKQVLSVGGGTATDIGKYISNKLNIKFICVPTMLSTNSYATDKVALIVNDKKVTLNAKLANLILIDKNIMEHATEFNLYGVADILSIYTALKDWDLSIKENNEVKTKEYDIAAELLDETIKYILNNDYETIASNPEKLFYLIGEAGHITNIYGCGKPESGSEHIFAKELESLIDIPHGIAVCNGIILMSIAQNNYSEDILNCFKKLKLFEKTKSFGVTNELIEKAFFNLKPREDRYSIVNTIYDKKELKEKIIEEFKQVDRGI